MKPAFDSDHKFTGFQGWSQQTAKVDKLTITDVKSPELGATQPSIVEAKLTLNVSSLPPEL